MPGEGAYTFVQTQHLLLLGRWATVAFAARAARRVLPLLGRVWPGAPRDHVNAVEWAVSHAESAARQGRTPLPLPSVAGALGAAVAGAPPLVGRMVVSSARAAASAATIAGRPTPRAAVVFEAVASSAWAAGHDAYAAACELFAPGSYDSFRCGGAVLAAGRADYAALRSEFGHATPFEAERDARPVGAWLDAPLWPDAAPPAWE
ncbi:MAG TPA: hypothetical protein VD971_02425 [Phycisphaerales bacterium]|nr:hypothetical protein [Phycisphaerales bacterium]